VPEPLTIAAALYGVGVLVGLVRTEARPAARVGLALLWPLGPVAFVVTVGGLLLVAAVAFPVVGLAAVAAAVLYRLLASL
jgi:hypothetical protein